MRDFEDAKLYVAKKTAQTRIDDVKLDVLRYRDDELNDLDALRCDLKRAEVNNHSWDVDHLKSVIECIENTMVLVESFIQHAVVVDVQCTIEET